MLLLVASVLLATVRTHHKARRQQTEPNFATQASGHHHHVRSHRVRATLVESPQLPTRPAAITEPVAALLIDAPILELGPPVARGPPSG
jgi:hypothetical protein